VKRDERTSGIGCAPRPRVNTESITQVYPAHDRPWLNARPDPVFDHMRRKLVPSAVGRTGVCSRLERAAVSRFHGERLSSDCVADVFWSSELQARLVFSSEPADPWRYSDGQFRGGGAPIQMNKRHRERRK
jgi:hypothetical protein